MFLFAVRFLVPGSQIVGKTLPKKYKRGWTGTRESGTLPQDLEVSEKLKCWCVLTGNWEQFKNTSATAPVLLLTLDFVVLILLIV